MKCVKIEVTKCIKITRKYSMCMNILTKHMEREGIEIYKACYLPSQECREKVGTSVEWDYQLKKINISL